MQHQEILPVLYDLSVTIGGEVRLSSLLTRTLQRLLYHTSFSAGFICLELPSCAGSEATQQVCIAAAVGDFELMARVGRPISLPCELLYGCAERVCQQPELLAKLATTRSRYHAFLRLPLDNQGVILLLAIEPPVTNLNLEQILQPVLAQLSRAIVLCRTQDAQQDAARVAQEKLQRSLEQVESQFLTLMELSPIGVCLSCDGFILNCNAAFFKLFGYTGIDQLYEQPLTQCVVPAQRRELAQIVGRPDQALASEAPYEALGLRRDGSQFAFLMSSKRVETDQGARTFSYVIDLTEQKRAEQELRSVNAMMRLVIETAPLRIFWKDRDLRYLGCNQAFARDAGLDTPDELVGKLDTQLGWRAQADLYRVEDLRVLNSNAPRLNFEEPQSTPDGRQVWLRTSKVPLPGVDGQPIGVLGIYDDITEQKRAEAQIHQLVHYDALTGLPNRRLLLDSLDLALAASARSRRSGAVLLIDLDDFKKINDTLGLVAGDKLLIEMAARLTSCVGEDGVVARPGGDEFIVMLEGLSVLPHEAAPQAELIAEKIRLSLSQPFLLDSAPLQTTPSIGIAVFQGNSDNSDALLKHADVAMYQAKDAGRNTIRFFDPLMQSELEDRLSLVADLEQAVARGQLALYFQKQVNSDGRALGAEVLLRWMHPMRGMVSPAQFIPLAEETGVIVPIGLWVLRHACLQLKAWQMVSGLRDLTLAVNVSAKQFHQADFVDQVSHILLATGAKPSHLKLELTESVVLEQVEDATAKMRKLKLLGISFSLDDFGTGYSSLQYLKRLPLDQVKIDQSFVHDITADPNDAAIVQTIIAMTEALGLNVIAEGVETRQQQEFLELRGCHVFQGFLFGRAVPLAQFESEINQRV